MLEDPWQHTTCRGQWRQLGMQAGGLSLGEVLPSSDVCPGGGSARGGIGGKFSSMSAHRLDQPTTPEGEAGRQGWGRVPLN
jgi:hypothetical protein